MIVAECVFSITDLSMCLKTLGLIMLIFYELS